MNPENQTHFIIGSRDGRITDIALVTDAHWFELKPPGVDRLTVINDFNPEDWTNSKIFQAWETFVQANDLD